MIQTDIEENTLGVAVGREGRYRQQKQHADRQRSFRRPERTVTTARANQDGLGGRHLGIGITRSGGFIAVFLLWRFGLQWQQHPAPLASLTAWVILAVAAVLTLVAVQRLSNKMPRRLFAAALAAGALVVVLDLVGCWGLTDAGIYPTAAPAVGALLTSMVTLRESRDVLTATAVLGIVMTIVALAETRSDPLTLAPLILAIGLGVIPPLLGAAIVRALRRMVQLELDLVLVKSTVSQPQFAVGMLASEDLARLDLAAETLLDDVAQGRTALPLAPETASTAASLATQLRLHLIEGRAETWLHHAVAESEFLEPSVTVHDPTGLAGLLSAAQRDALLLAVWLLICDTAHPAAKVSLVLGPVSPTRLSVDSRHTVIFPIELTTTGVPRRGVDPETWQAIGVVGPHVDSVRDGSLCLDIECRVDNPADA